MVYPCYKDWRFDQEERSISAAKDGKNLNVTRDGLKVIIVVHIKGLFY